LRLITASAKSKARTASKTAIVTSQTVALT
jgi:hypothetical protein